MIYIILKKRFEEGIEDRNTMVSPMYVIRDATQRKKELEPLLVGDSKLKEFYNLRQPSFLLSLPQEVVYQMSLRTFYTQTIIPYSESS